MVLSPLRRLGAKGDITGLSRTSRGSRHSGIWALLRLRCYAHNFCTCKSADCIVEQNGVQLTEAVLAVRKACKCNMSVPYCAECRPGSVVTTTIAVGMRRMHHAAAAARHIDALSSCYTFDCRLPYTTIFTPASTVMRFYHTGSAAARVHAV